MPKISAEFSHSLGAVLDYGFDWNKWLRTGETITGSTWEAPGMTLGTEYNNGDITTVFVSDLLVGKVYKLTNHIVTSAGREDSRTIVISCKRR